MTAGTIRDNENLFPAYFAAYESFHRNNAHRYGVLPNFVYVASSQSIADNLYSYLHEDAHAQLSESVQGLTLQTVLKLAALVEKLLFGMLREWLLAIKSEWPRQHRELFLFGNFDARRCEVEPLARVLSATDRHNLRELLEDKKFSAYRAAFGALNERYTRLWSRWRIVHEGIATVHAVGAGLGVSDAAEDPMRRACGVLEVEFSETVERELHLRAEWDSRRFSVVAGKRSTHGLGWDLVYPFSDGLRRVSRAWTAAAVASHFPYYACRLLDMPGSQFECISRGGYLDAVARMANLRGRETELDSCVMGNGDDGQRLLAIASGACDFVDLSANARLFGQWERDYLWDSALMTGVLGRRASEMFGAEGMRRMQQLDFDHSSDFRLFEVNEPTIVQEGGVILQSDPDRRAAFCGNFIDGYEVARTTRLLKTLTTLAA